ncbi:MAG: sigma-70 family RNA polymerase sigma factor [Solirubrobacterales bacterium]|nr:sigma-70 family RNA polymerase sigma factor [Solirubrobacterales bacterium]
MVRNVSPDVTWDWEEAREICLRVARRYARGSGEAEDIAQNAVIRAWRYQHKLRDGERRSEWLSRIARNEALRALERNIPEPSEVVEQGGEEDHRLEGVIESATVQAALANLSEADRELILLRYDSDLTQSAIAERLGIPEGTVKVRLHRARARLRKGPEIT